MNAKKIKKSTGLMSQTKPPSLFLSSQMTTAGSSNVFLSASEARIQDYVYLCAINTNVSNFVSVKLSGSHNYLLWKAQMVCLLDSKNMCGIVDSTFATPRFSGTEIMRQYDSLVRGWIFGSVTDDVLVDVIHLDSAKAAWDKLKSIHDPTDVRNKKKMEWSILPVRFPDNVWDAIDNLEYSDATVMKTIKTNAESCSITAALITAITFAAGINMPDVSNKEMGISAFKEKIALIIFVISNAISLFASNTALLVFLSILTTHFAERDKLQSLPRRLFIGIFSFFLCIAAMMVALSATLFRVFCDPNPWKLVMISGLLFIAIAFFVAVQFPLMVDLFKGTYLGIFGKQQKRHAVRDFNYYKNLREVTINGECSEVESMLQKQELVTEQISSDGCTTLQLAAETGTKENDVGYTNAFNDDFNGDPVDVDEDGEAALSLGSLSSTVCPVDVDVDVAKGSMFPQVVFGYLPLAIPARRLDMVRPTVEQPVLNLLSRRKVEYVCLLVHNNCKSSTTYYTAASDFNRSTHNSHAKTLQVLNLANKGSNLRVFTVAELKTATVNFCTASKIGEGVFGSVYKGVIKSFDHRPMQVVVKLTNELLQGQKERETEINVPGVIEHPNLAKLIGYCAEDTEPGTQLLLVYEYMVNGTVRDHLSTKSETPLSWNMRLKVAQDVAQGLAYLHEQMEFQAEVNFIGRLSQPNLVKLLGYCDEGNELLLVYEFMQKGSLENHLFGRGSTVQPLPWDIRLKISIGAARGLAFLHTSEKQVIYRDFKLSNISLDASYNAKISDFGLAKVGPSATQSHVTTRVMGTYGYAAPEYVSTDRTTLVLGKGGFGWVHKGWLEDKSSSKSIVIAVKKLNSENMQGLEEWQAEVNFIGRLSQPNLVKLLGYCYEGNELLLVYEFMQKGSLENHLFGRGSTVQPIPRDMQLKISIGAARGHAFLHTSEKQVIYRDFKASNILLDGSYNAKISDFGLAKVGPSATQSHVTTRVVGTYGYAAPEYVSTEVLKVLMEMHLELSMTFDQSNTTSLHTASEQGHIEVVNYLLEKNSCMANIARSNLKTALHSCARQGHLDVVKALSQKVPGIVARADKKGQTALHMAVKGQNVEVVNALIEADNGLINMVDKQGNTALHITTRKGRTEIVCALLNHKGTINKQVINKYGETPLDTAEKFGRSEIAIILQKHGVPKARSIKNTQPPLTPTTRELKQTVSDIKHGVHDQLEHAIRTQKRVKGIGKRINKMHLEGLNNAINSTTVVAVLIATVTFAAIFQLPGQYVDDPKQIPHGFSLGEGNIAANPEFIVFLLFDSLALFISLAVVVVQTSIVVVEKRAKKQVMAVINKLMWLACVFVSVAFLALSFIVVGNEKWLAVGVTVIGSVTLASTLGTMCYWIITHRMEAKSIKSRRMSGSVSISPLSDSENEDFRKLYAI